MVLRMFVRGVSVYEAPTGAAAAAAAAGAAAADSLIFSRSLATILPLGPEPFTFLREIPFSRAMVLANGEAMIRPLGFGVEEDLDSDLAGAALDSLEVSLDSSLDSCFGSSLDSAGLASPSPASSAVKFSKAATSLDSSTYTAIGFPTGIS